MAEVTVIVPAYNAGAYIKECLESLRNQTLKDIEVLVINDGSTDNTEAIIDDYIKKHTAFQVKKITTPNKGAAYARNIGIKIANGRYIGFIDADDTVDCRMFGKMFQLALSEKADLVTCDFFWTYKNGKRRKCLLADSQNIRDMFSKAWVAPWNKLYRKQMLIENNILFPEGFTYEDTSFYLKCIPFCRQIKHISAPFVFWRQHKSSTMGQIQNKRIPQIFPVLDEAIDFYKVHGIYEEYETNIEFFCTKLLWGSHMYRICQVRDKNERMKYICLTLEWLNRKFPKWKKNLAFQSGIRGFYIKSMTPNMAEIYSQLIYFARYYGRNRM